ncbi:MAG TPA: hypothetical protein VFA99_11375 [Acidobacteriaceae bacterium]|nr:hypothetical protein [Acidobacteriaceae bacterium]
MQKRVSDLPPLLSPGIHEISMQWLQENGVDAFSLSKTRPHILEGLARIVRQLEELRIECSLIVDGSFLTQEIDPLDIDFAVCVTPDFYESCDSAQLECLDWIRDSFDIKKTHLCECYLCVEYPEDHPEWFGGIQNRAYWVNLFAKSVVYKRVRGVGEIRLGVGA